MTAAPTTPQPRFATTRLETGLLVHYAEQGAANGEVLLFLHGWPDSWFSFSRVLALLPADFHAYALDQRGFGNSERPAAGYTIDQYAGDVVAFLKAVEVERATLVAHSFGTFVARRVAETRPEQVARLALIGSAVRPVNEVLLEVQASLQPLADPLPLEFVREFQASALHRPVPDEFFERIVVESQKAPARVWREAFDGLLACDDAADLAQIAVPTLLLWGDQDGLFPGEAGQQALEAAIPGARLRVYQDTGHSPNWERPEAVADDLVTFVREAP